MNFNWINRSGVVTGYGQVAKGMIRGLEQLGHIQDDEGIKIYHDVPFPSTMGADVVYTMFEMFPAPTEWRYVLKNKKVFTGSRWSAHCLQSDAIVTGHGCSMAPKPRKFDWDGFRFGCWAEHVPRKFLHLLTRAFEDEFKDDDDAHLFVKTWSVNKNVSMLFAGLKKSTLVIGNVKNMATLYAKMNAYVLPSIEGWGMTQMEAIISGIKPIVLNFGGVLDFCNTNNSVMVDHDIKTVPHDPHFPHGRLYMKWAMPKMNDLRKKMRYVYEKGGMYLEKSDVREFRKKWTWKKCAQKLVDNL